MQRIQSREVSDAFWERVEPLVPVRELDPKRKVGGGRNPIPARRIFEAIIYVLRTGFQWKALPSGDVVSKSMLNTTNCTLNVPIPGFGNKFSALN